MCGTLRGYVPERRDPTQRGGGAKQAIGEAAGVQLFAAKASGLAQSGCGGAEADDPEHVLETATRCPLLGTAEDERLDAQPPAYEERSCPGRSPELVGADGEQVGTELVEVDRHMTYGCGCIDMHWHARRLANRQHLAHRLQGSDLVVAH